MNTTIPIKTAVIFEKLSKGQFISEDGDDESKELFKIIELGGNYEILQEYFLQIDFFLEKGNGYYYFSRGDKETSSALQDKIIRAYKWIDILDFLVSYGKAKGEIFGPGYIFSPTQIFEECKVNQSLMEKLDDLKRYYDLNSEKPFERIEQLVKLLKRETFINEYNALTKEYKVLAAFDYLNRLIECITINDDEEISE